MTHYKKKINNYLHEVLPAHASMLQLFELVSSPSHGAPPPTRAVLLHNRVLVCTPSPHVTEHCP